MPLTHLNHSDDHAPLNHSDDHAITPLNLFDDHAHPNLFDDHATHASESTQPCGYESAEHGSEDAFNTQPAFRRALPEKGMSTGTAS